MPNVVHRHTKALNRTNTKQNRVARLREYNLVGSFKALRSKDRVSDIPCHSLTGGGNETSLAARLNVGRAQCLCRQPCQLRTRVNQSFKWRSFSGFVLWIFGNDVDSEKAHGFDCTTDDYLSQGFVAKSS